MPVHNDDGKFCGISSENNFSKLFLWKIPFFLNILEGKISHCLKA
jgi:hypothetical protein